MTVAPDVSIVIPCRAGVTTIGEQLRALATQQGIAGAEVLVADNGLNPGLAGLLTRELDGVCAHTVVDATRSPGINVARNVGVRAVASPRVLLCDADDLVQPGWLAAHLAAFEAGHQLLGGTTLRVFAGQQPVRSMALDDSLGFLPWPAGANCGFTVEIYRELGGFDERFRGGGDEVEFFWRGQLAGHALHAVPDAVVLYRERPTLPGVYRQHRSYGRSHAQLYRLFRDRGMPGPGARSLLPYLKLPAKVAARAWTTNGRRAVTGDAAVLWGRLSGSLRYRTVFL